MLEALNFPQYTFSVQWRKGRPYLFDPLRQRWVRLTPEEWVRQHLAQHLVQALGYPAALIAFEAALTDQNRSRRADLIVYDRQGRPLLLAECKAPSVPITQTVVEQAGRYNRIVGAPYLVVTNGHVHYAWYIDPTSQSITSLAQLPTFAAMLQGD